MPRLAVRSVYQPPLRQMLLERLEIRGLVEGHAIVGLTAGASTPEELVRATAARLAEVGYALPEEITVAKEDVHFRLPKEVART